MAFNQFKKYAALAAGVIALALGTGIHAEGLIAKEAPAFELKSQGGGKPGANIKLSDYKGQIVLINFWASWCGPCREEMPLLEELYNKYKNQGLVILGVNVESETDKAMKFLEKVPVTFPILLDDKNTVSETYMVDSMPTTYVINRQGVVKSHHRGYKEGYMEKYDQEIQELLNQK